MSDTPVKIILSPEAQRLSRECETLRDEVARLLIEAHDLVQVVKPNLLALYRTKLGAWELKRLQLECDIGRLKRKISLIQAKMNRGAPVDEVELEGQLDLELIEWRTRVDEAVAALEAATTRLEHPMAEEEARELRDLYRALVKRLHPDLNADLTDAERHLWHRVQQAYDRADIEELRALALVQPSSASGAGPSALEQLASERDALESHITRLLAEIAAIESQPPFTMRKQLADSEWINSTRKAIDDECILLEAQRTDLETHVDQILASAHNGHRFSRN